MARNIFFAVCGLILLALLINERGQSQAQVQLPPAQGSQIHLHVSHAQACVRLAEAELSNVSGNEPHGCRHRAADPY